MRTLINQIRQGIENKLYYLSLYTSLTLPDICGAMDSENGKATNKKYMEWFDKYVSQRYLGIGGKESTFKGKDCYYFRCSLLHQGSTQKSKSRYSKILFIEPNDRRKFHNNIFKTRGEKILNIDVNIFCKDVTDGADEWLKDVENTDRYKKHYEKFMKRHPKGYSPVIIGVPVIC